MPEPKHLSLPESGPPDAETLRAAVDALAAGQAVILPTETVYGLAFRADDAGAAGFAAAARGGLTGRPVTLHRASAAGLAALSEFPAMSARLLERYAPGPLRFLSIEEAAEEGRWVADARPSPEQVEVAFEGGSELVPQWGGPRLDDQFRRPLWWVGERSASGTWGGTSSGSARDVMAAAPPPLAIACRAALWLLREAMCRSL